MLVQRPPAPQHAQQRRVEDWLRNSGRRLVLPACFVVLCAALVAWRDVQWTHSSFYSTAGPALPLAKCFVTVAEVCFGLLFLPVLRNLVTWLRCVVVCANSMQVTSADMRGVTLQLFHVCCDVLCCVQEHLGTSCCRPASVHALPQGPGDCGRAVRTRPLHQHRIPC